MGLASKAEAARLNCAASAMPLCCSLHGKLPSLNLCWLSWPLSAGARRCPCCLSCICLHSLSGPHVFQPALQMSTGAASSCSSLHLPNVLSCSHSALLCPAKNPEVVTLCRTTGGFDSMLLQGPATQLDAEPSCACLPHCCTLALCLQGAVLEAM